MDAKKLQDALGTIVTVLRDLRDLRGHRIGNASTDELRSELDGINRQIAATGNGLLARQKLEWFHLDSIRRELGGLKLIMETVQKCMDEDVRQELLQEGQPLDKIQRHLENSLDWITVFRGATDRYEQLADDVSKGAALPAQELASLENRLLRFNDWEEQVLAMEESAMVRIAPYARSLKSQSPTTLRRIAASVILGLTAAAAMMFSGTVYAQDVAKGEGKQQQALSVNDQISVLEAKLDKSPEEFLKLAELYAKSEKLDKATDTLNAYLKTHPNDIRGLVQKRELDGKKGVKYKSPDDDLKKIIDAYDDDKYTKFVTQDKKFKEAINDLEPFLAQILSYDLKELNETQKLKMAGLLNVLAAAYSATNKDNQALAACAECMVLAPKWSGPYSISAEIFRLRKEYTQAIAMSKKVIENKPQSHIGYSGLGYCYQDQGDYENALKYFKEALARAPDKYKDKYQKLVLDCQEKINK